MHTRNESIEIKELAVAALSNTKRGLYHAALAVCLWQILASDFEQNLYVCEDLQRNTVDKNFLNTLINTLTDMGINIFNSTFLISGALIPLGLWTSEQFYRAIYKDEPLLTKKARALLETIDAEFIMALFSPIFIKNMIDRTTAIWETSDTARYCIYMTTAFPLAVQAMRLVMERYYGMEYKDFYSASDLIELIRQNKKIELFKAAIESTCSGLNFASAANGTAWLAIDLFYDGLSKNDFVDTNQTIMIATAIAALMGSASILHPRSKKVIKDAASTFNMSYLLEMLFVSELMCMFQNLEKVSAYKKIGVYPVSALYIFALGMAFMDVILPRNAYPFTHANQDRPLEDRVEDVTNEYTKLNINTLIFPSANNININIDPVDILDQSSESSEEVIQNAVTQNEEIKQEETKQETTKPVEIKSNLSDVNSGTGSVSKSFSSSSSSPKSPLIKQGIFNSENTVINIPDEIKEETKSNSPSPRGASDNES